MSWSKLAQEVAATVVEQLPRLLFRVALEDHRQLLCHVAGKLRKNFVRLLPGTESGWSRRRWIRPGGASYAKGCRRCKEM